MPSADERHSRFGGSRERRTKLAEEDSCKGPECGRKTEKGRVPTRLRGPGEEPTTGAASGEEDGVLRRGVDVAIIGTPCCSVCLFKTNANKLVAEAIMFFVDIFVYHRYTTPFIRMHGCTIRIFLDLRKSFEL